MDLVNQCIGRRQVWTRGVTLLTKLDFLKMCGKDNVKWGLEKYRRYMFYLFYVEFSIMCFFVECSVFCITVSGLF
jgi:hypothetical protein